MLADHIFVTDQSSFKKSVHGGRGDPHDYGRCDKEERGSFVPTTRETVIPLLTYRVNG